MTAEHSSITLDPNVLASKPYRFARCLMWTTENRQPYNRDKLRYPSDMTDEEWSRVSPLIPPAKRGLSAEHIPVIVARDRHGATTDAVLPN